MVDVQASHMEDDNSQTFSVVDTGSILKFDLGISGMNLDEDLNTDIDFLDSDYVPDSDVHLSDSSSDQIDGSEKALGKNRKDCTAFNEGDDDDDNDDDDDDDVVATVDKKLKEEEIVRDIKNPKIYMRKHLKSKEGSGKQHKKGLRVYNNYHACYVCGRLVLHISTHMQRHRNVIEVKEVFSQTKKDFSSLRKLGDNKHNQHTVEIGEGEIILARRPTSNVFDITKYGPCPECFEWVLLKSIKYHHKGCLNEKRKKTGVKKVTRSKKDLMIHSQILAGHLKSNASQLMQKEVFPIMTSDKIGMTAQNDPLILTLGESWLRRNLDNTEKRKYYASQRMRLCARLLLQLRQMNQSDEKQSQEDSSDSHKDGKEKCMWDYLKPSRFDDVALAAIKCCIPFVDDEEDLQSPSNAIKLKYDIRRLLNAKWANVIKSMTDVSEANDCKSFLGLMDVEWNEKVTKHARTVLQRRKYETKKTLPSPMDVQKLTKYLVTELENAVLTKDNFHRNVMLTQARLLLYNKRRSGELETIKTRSYAARMTGMDDIDNSLTAQMTDVEKHLLQSQAVLKVRGKRGRPVPVIIPSDAKLPLDFIATKERRNEAGINPDNPYLFPNSAFSYARGYSSLKTVCSECSLAAPERITSVTMRKYTATLSQMMNLTNNQLDWVCKHLGHTQGVHKTAYQQMSDVIEKVYISKLMLIQDLNLTNKYQGKDLENVDIRDIVYANEAADEDVDEDIADGARAHVHDDVQISADEDEINNLSGDESQSEKSSDEEPQPAEKRKKTAFHRKRWTPKEEEEIHLYFKSYIQSGTTPRRDACEKGKLKSKKHNGELYKRENHLIIKKISAMNHAKKRKVST
ncbi:uncharacterized protein LOC117319213 [Pecten maximus]|uniref:uncharacterized protein LOC117319213 n=1 Tax=Pecten maximus TaxID=6579 RepID=UPI0014584584|nr:uncharacterized protein LOC117319213 [Pecten maximus]